ncbi:MFS transporter [Streptosporangium carneum]|uniref:Major facilitator superfamily (MFS) profile domain-containing protein n=1 Tax=Streptosporangium carneum TaxID=47481 RepID=A0A9W6HZQ1_9ACTN|nr:MFS transporter [Streptosporangium carneum]GLK08624.1 hypothetical protein GCM10017600_20290 [Streptosporangium carneum]
MTERWRTLGVLTTGVLLLSVNVRVLDAALPPVALDSQVSLAVFTWPIYAYLLALLGVLIPVGPRRGVLLSGLAGFGLASVLCAFAFDAGMAIGGHDVYTVLLVGGRAVQGLTAAIAVRAGSGLVAAAFPGQVGRAAVAPLTAAGAGLLLGPGLGAAVDDHFSYSSIFLLDALSVLMVLAAVMVLTPRSAPVPEACP